MNQLSDFLDAFFTFGIVMLVSIVLAALCDGTGSAKR